MEILYHIKLKAIFWGRSPCITLDMPHICLIYALLMVGIMAIGHHWTRIILTVLTVLTGQAFERSSAGASALSGALWISLVPSGPCSDLAKGRRDEKTSWTCMDQMPQPRIFRYHMVSRRNDWQLTIGSLEMGEGEKGESATAINRIWPQSC